MSCHQCGEPSCGGCDPCNDNDNYCVCLGRQIEQLKNRTDQLKAQVECLNEGEPFDGLCPIQSCDSPDCQNTGTMCDNNSPTGRPVGAGGDSCCGQANPANMQDQVDGIAKKQRDIDKRLIRLEKLVCEIREQALKTVLLDSTGAARGGLNLKGEIKSFTVGSWELATS